MKVLVINSGSSSIKYKLFRMPQERLLEKGLIEHIGERGSKTPSHHHGLKMILERINGRTSLAINRERSRRVNSVSAVGHRVVHGD
jgi:acetate kinase